MNEETKQYPNPIAERETKPAPAEAPDFLKGDDWYGVDIHEDFLDFTERYQPPRYTLQRHGVKFANVGDLHIISGKPGNGKTGLMTQFMAALLCGKNGNTEYALPSRKPKVLYVDTEQSKDDSIALKNRVCVIAKGADTAAVTAAVPGAAASASKSRGDYAYFLMDTDSDVDAAAIEAIPGVIKVRVLSK